MFLLGPSHHHYLSDCALSKCTEYETPLGNLKIDLDTVKELRSTKAFQDMSQSVDENEHSLEMHLPYIYKMLSKYAVPELFTGTLTHARIGPSLTQLPFPLLFRFL